MGNLIEPLREQLTKFYSGEEPIDPSGRALRALWDAAVDASHEVEDESEERRWLNGLFGTIREWGLEDDRQNIQQQTNSFNIFRDGLPGRIPFFVGRKQDCDRLDDWLAGDKSIIQIVAAGGYGKTQLVNQWLRSIELARQQSEGAIESVFCWCFYAAQGRSVSFGEFLNQAISFFQRFDPDRSPPIHEKQAEYLADLISNGRSLLVLDGLEALQWKPTVSVEARDSGSIAKSPIASAWTEIHPNFRQMVSLLEAVGVRNGAKVVITTRQRVGLTKDLPSSMTLRISGLRDHEGSKILSRLRVKGSEYLRRRIANDLNGHPLALSLLGFTLAWHYEGNAFHYQKAMLSSHEGIGYHHSVHDNEIVASYVSWLHESSEMQLLRLVGFFHQRKIPLSSLEPLIVSEELSEVTDWLSAAVLHNGKIDWGEIHSVLWTLKDNMLLLSDVNQPTNNDSNKLVAPELVYDAHPQLREYFANQLLNLEGGKFWKAGQRILLETYLSKAGTRVETSTQAAAVFDAIAHACQGGYFLLAFNAYWHRLHHNGSTPSDLEWYGWHRLGTYAEDLSALAWFFRNPWSEFEDGASAQLNDEQLAMIQFAVVECLKNQGLAPEAKAPIQRFRRLFQRDDQRRTQMSIMVGFECERRLAQGELEKAIESGKQAVSWARKSSNARQIVSQNARLADAFAAKGSWARASHCFQIAIEAHSSSKLDSRFLLSGYSGFLLGEFLLTRAEIVLSGWDSKRKFLLDTNVDERVAISDLERVIDDALCVIAREKTAISRQDAILHEFLWLRATGIHNILVMGKSGFADVDIHKDLNQKLAALEGDFDQFSHGELPRLFIKRSKVLRRLSELSSDESPVSLLDEAADCLVRGSLIAEQGNLLLHQADLTLEKTKVLICRAKVMSTQEREDAGIKNVLKSCLSDAMCSIRSLKYGKRYPELWQLESDVKNLIGSD